MSVCVEPGCPNLATHRGRCPTHGGNPNAHRSPNRNRPAQARFRRLVLARDRYTCQDCGHHDPTGRTLRACHLLPLHRGGSYEPSNGITRCQPCDKATDPYAR